MVGQCPLLVSPVAVRAAICKRGNMQEDQYPRIGIASPGQPSYILAVSDFISPLNPPPSYNMPAINPEEYFITSGDAVQKTKYLCKVLWRYAGQVRRKLKSMRPTAGDLEFERSCWRQAGAAVKMLHALIKIRGEHIFLETEWNSDRTLRVICKDPRVRSEIDVKEVVEVL